MEMPRLIGHRIRSARSAKRLSQEALGAIVGLDQAFISRLENGTSEGTPSQLVSIAKALGTTVSHLLDNIEVRDPTGLYRIANGLADILNDPSTPQGLRELASDHDMVEMLEITAAEWRALASIEPPGPISKVGYVNLLFTLRAIVGNVKPA